MSNYTFKRVSENEYADLVYLFNNAFAEKTTIGYYINKNATQYLGPKHLGYIAYDENNSPAAFYGIYPYLVEYKGEKILAAQSGDTMTHKNHVRKGLFAKLGKMTYELAKTEGIQFVFGFPNKYSYHGLVKSLQWTHVENMNQYVFKVHTLPLARLAKKFPFLISAYKKFVGMVLNGNKKGVTIFDNSIEKNWGQVIHSSSFYQYKSFYDNHLIELEGRRFWIKIDGYLMIGDIEVKGSDNVEEALTQLKKKAFWLGCDRIMFVLSKNTYWDNKLSTDYTPEEGLAVCELDLQSNLPLEDFKFVHADLDTF